MTTMIESQAAAALDAIVDDLDAILLELPEDGPHYGSFYGFYADVYDRPTFIFPIGQDPRQRLTVARQLLAQNGRDAA